MWAGGVCPVTLACACQGIRVTLFSRMNQARASRWVQSQPPSGAGPAAPRTVSSQSRCQLLQALYSVRRRCSSGGRDWCTSMRSPGPPCGSQDMAGRHCAWHDPVTCGTSVRDAPSLTPPQVAGRAKRSSASSHLAAARASSPAPRSTHLSALIPRSRSCFRSARAAASRSARSTSSCEEVASRLLNCRPSALRTWGPFMD